MSVSDFGINRQPTPLLRFLGLSGPDAPARLSELVDGNVDLLPWWATASMQGAASAVTPAAAFTGFQSHAIVPAGQRWLLVGASVTYPVTVAAHTVSLIGAIDDNFAGSGPTAIGPQGTVGAFPSNLALDLFAGSAFPFLLLGPGDRLGCIVMTNVGATPAAITLRYRFASFAV